MITDLLEVVQSELAARKPDWREIANELDMSYEFISRLGLGTYESSPTIGRLRKIYDHLSKNRARQSQRRTTSAGTR